MRIKTSYILVVLIILIAIGVRIFVFFNTDHYDGDSIHRIIGSYRYASHPFNIAQYYIESTGASGQLSYFFLNTLLMHFVDEPILISRIISFIFGILMIIPYYWLIKLAFSQDIALASIFVLAFYSVHILYSVISLAVAECLFFIILAVYFSMQHLYKTDSKKSKIYFIASIISTILATSFRVDAWPLVVFLSFVFLKEKRLKEALIFFVFSSFYIITISCIYYKVSGNLLLSSFKTMCLPTPVDPAPLVFINSSFKGLSRLLITRPDMPSYGKYQISIWFGTLFYTLSFLLSLLGFLGMFDAFKNKKQYVFFLNFWCFFILLTLRQIISNHYPDERYSYIIVIFFIPFIFLGVTNIVLYICRRLGLAYFYKRVLVISLMMIASTYFIFVSRDHFIKDLLPRMKYNFFIRNLTNWVGKNINSGDIIIFPAYTSELYTAELENKFVGINYYIDNLTVIFNHNKEYKLDKEIINEIQDFIRKQRVVETITGTCVSRLLIKRGHTYKARRIVFILDERFYKFLKEEHPNLLKKIEIKYDGFLYSGVLPLL